MKVLFVYPDIGVRGGARSYQFGIGMLSAVLKAHGHETRLHYMFGAYDPAPLKQTLAAYQPDLIAFSAVSPQFRFVKQIFKDLQPFPAFTILGGHHATLAPECLESIEGLDAICIGEGEYPLLELAETLQKGGDPRAIRNLWVKTRDFGLVKNPTRPFMEDLDALPFPDRELFDYQPIINSDFHTALFMFSRGCPYDCTFCSNHALRTRQEGKYVRFRSVASCLREIREVLGRYAVRSLYFNDDCFTARRDFVDAFCARYKQECALPFAINARPETLNDDVCRVLKAAGCHRVSIGIESGSESFRREVLGRRQSNDRIAEAFAACRRAGIKTKSFNIVGFPHETPAIFQETVDLNARIQPDSVIIGIFEPYPGTKLAEVCLQEGFIPKDQPDTWFMGRMDTILTMPNFPRREILRCFRNFAFNVYKRHAPLKALFYKIYYSPVGERLIRALAPVKDVLRRLVMGV
ncbi:MAG: radical SAM protein [Kiritimatiellaeota bacterium]|nr:radical SAM protein [Kiritimatiellota bacterium]